MLEITWDGDVKKFPPLLVTIKRRVIYMHWDDRKTGITNVNGKEIFGEYQSITETDVATAKADCTNGREIQNVHVLYNALHTSLTGDINTQIFSQITNIPGVDYGVSLFIHMKKTIMSTII